MARHSLPKSKRSRRTASVALDADALNAALLAAVELQRDGRLGEAGEIYARVEASNPERLEAPHLRAMIDVERGQLDLALDRMARVVRRKPDWFEAQTSLAFVYAELGRWGEAIAAYRRALQLRPRDAEARLALAGALEVSGRLDEARDLLRDLAADGETRLAALIRIAQLRPAEITDAELAELGEAARDTATGEPMQINLAAATGAVLERRGRYDEAFEAFATANRIKRRQLVAGSAEPTEREMTTPLMKTRALNPQAVAQGQTAAISFLKAMFTPEFFERHQGAGSHIAAPIFIVGMPRSGSTLLEQILSSHPRVQGVGENAALHQTLCKAFPYDLAAPAPADHFQRLAAGYLARVHALGWKSAPRFVDKTLYNYMHVGMIGLMFPRSIVINSARDPVDTCLAQFRQTFHSGQETTYDLRDIGEAYQRYREVLAHWDQVLPGRVVSVSHEALVADPEREIPRLITAVCGLPWDDACLKFHETQRPVRTASVAQVRQPIFTTSVERWRQYEKHLDPLFESLGPYAPAPRRVFSEGGAG